MTNFMGDYVACNIGLVHWRKSDSADSNDSTFIGREPTHEGHEIRVRKINNQSAGTPQQRRRSRRAVRSLGADEPGAKLSKILLRHRSVGDSYVSKAKAGAQPRQCFVPKRSR